MKCPPRHDRFLHDHEDVHGVVVLAEGSWDEAVVVLNRGWGTGGRWEEGGRSSGADSQGGSEEDLARAPRSRIAFSPGTQRSYTECDRPCIILARGGRAGGRPMEKGGGEGARRRGGRRRGQLSPRTAILVELVLDLGTAGDFDDGIEDPRRFRTCAREARSQGRGGRRELGPHRTGGPDLKPQKIEQRASPTPHL